MSWNVSDLRHIPQSIRTFLKNVLVPPGLAEARQDQAKDNRAAILAATILLFIARGLEFKGDDLMATILLSGGVVALALMFASVAKLFATQKERQAIALKWTAFLVAVWMASLLFLIVVDVSCLSARLMGASSVTTLAVFLQSKTAAAIIVSIGGMALVMLKSKLLNRRPVGSMIQIARYASIGTIFNSILVYFLVYARWQ